MQLYYCFPQPSEGPSGHTHSGRLRPRADIHQHPVKAQQSHRHTFLEYEFQNSTDVYGVNLMADELPHGGVLPPELRLHLIRQFH